MTTLPHPNTACLRCASQPTGEGIAKLRELAQAATPGPWSHSDGKLTPDKIWIYGGEHRVRLALAEWGIDFGQDIQATTMANAAYIAAANPAAILSLLDQLAALKAERDRFKVALEKIAAFTDEGASNRLAATGSYGAFDESGSVAMAREALHG